jgi:hypothetical protein
MNVAIWYWKRALLGFSVVLGTCIAGCGEPPAESGQAVVSALDTGAPDAGAPQFDAGAQNGAMHAGGGSGAGKVYGVAVPPRRDLSQ